jgi:ATP-dependent DNA ligase
MSKTKQSNFKIAGAVEFKGRPLKCDYLYAEEKLDGMRMIIVMDKGKGFAYTRNGCEITNAKYIIRELENRPALFWDVVLDGEAVILKDNGKVDFNLSQSICMTETPHERAKDLTYRVFDILRLSEWKAQKGEKKLVYRKKKLEIFLKRLSSKRITIVPYRKIKATDADIKSHLRKMVRKGFEGSVFKKPESVYSFRKNNDWLKLKPFQEGDFEIIGTKPGKKGKTGQMLGLIGSLEVKGVVDGKKVTFNSSGMSMALRKEMTAMHKKKKLVGKIVEVHHEGLTVKNKVRFPRFQRLRLDK